jgi:hypothetical protein
MKNKIKKNILISFLLAITALGCFSFVHNSKAAINKQFNYQGKLTDTSGVAVADGAYNIVFKLYTVGGGGGGASWTESWINAALFTNSSTTFTNDGCAAGIDKMAYTPDGNESSLASGQTLWNTTKKQSAVIQSVNTTGVGGFICFYDPYATWASADEITNRIYVKNGLFSVMVGSLTAQTVDFTADTYYLGVTVGLDAEMIPRKKIGAVPQAWNANNVVGDGYVDIDNTSTAQDAVNINYNPASGANDAMDITYGSGGGTGNALSVTQSGAGNIVNLVGGSITSGTGLALSVNGLTTGSGLAIDSTSTAFNGGKLLNLSASGALSSAGTVYGVYSALTGANANNTNIAGYFSASGAGSTNYGLIVAGGNVGIGDTSPLSLFTVGSEDLFQVNSSGQIAAVTGYTQGSGNFSISGAGTFGTGTGAISLNGATSITGSNTFNVGTGLTTLGGNLTVTGTAWTATPTISGIVTMTSGFDSNAASTVAGLTVDTNGNLTVSNGTLSVTAPSATGNAGAIIANSLTTGNAFDISSTSTAGGVSGVSKLLNLSRSGTNTQLAHTAYGVYSAVTNINATSGTNIAGYFSASGATTANYGLIVENGNAGIGSTSPAAKLTVRSDSTGATVSLFRAENLDTAAIGTGGSVDFYANRTTGGSTQFTSLESVVTSIDNTYYSGKLNMKIASNGSLVTMMEIGNPNIVMNRPLEVNVAGDTGISYDLQFLNTGGSFITSQGALTISAGNPNKIQNLTLTTQANQESGDSGIATAGGASTLTDGSKSWVTDIWANGTIYIISGAGAGQERTVSSNTATVITVSSAWTVQPNTTSFYRLAYQQGGDVIVDVANSSNNIGGFKVAGMDNGGYVFRVGPAGNVEIGGNGAGGSNLNVKQNLTLTGGNITIGKLNITQAGTPSGTASTTGGSMATTTYYYAITALNNNGETTRSAESSGISVTGPNGSVVLSWTSVSGAVGYKIYRTTSSGTYGGTNLIKYVATPVTAYTDIAASASAGAPPIANTTGGSIAGILSFSDATELTLSDNTTGAITINQTYHRIDTLSDASTGNLVTINGGTSGNVLVLRAEHTDRTVVVKDGTGNIQLSADMTLDNTQDTLALIYDGSNWLEISRVDSGADVAESYYTDDLSINAGDTVKIAQLNDALLSEEDKLKEHKYPAIAKTGKSYDSGVMGVISTSPSIGLGGGYNKLSSGAETRPVVLAGRTSVKVSLENGFIEVGDFLVSSSMSGVAMKASKSGRVIGQALESFDGNITECDISFVKKIKEKEGSEKNNAGNNNNSKEETVKLVDCKKIPSEIGKVMTFINVGWQEIQDSSAIVDWNADGGKSSEGMLGSISSSIKTALKELGAIIDKGILKIKSIFVEDITANKLCIKGEDGEIICVEKDQLKDILNKNQIVPASLSPSNIEGNSNSALDISVIPVPTGSPSPSPIPIPVPIPSAIPALTP